MYQEKNQNNCHGIGFDIYTAIETNEPLWTCHLISSSYYIYILLCCVNEEITWLCQVFKIIAFIIN